MGVEVGVGGRDVIRGGYRVGIGVGVGVVGW